jgi:hypothetical protein
MIGVSGSLGEDQLRLKFGKRPCGVPQELSTEYWVLLSAMPNMHHIPILHNVIFAF